MPAVTIPTKLDSQSGVILDMLGIPSIPGEPAFDSYLIKHQDGGNNHTLTLVLKIHLDPVLPASINLPGPFRMLYPDWGKKMLLIKPWKASEWAQFKNSYKQECNFWNNNFWLIPPDNFTALDVKMGARTVRPNIYCHLYVDLVGSAAGAHRSIVVVNLDTAANAFFRSDDMHYSSQDVNVRDNGVTDEAGKPVKFYTVTHEVGHALGLPHIGQTHNDPLCQLAILLGQKLPTAAQQSQFVPAILQGGIGATTCYGSLGPPDRAKNVMGLGSRFEPSNASPWQERLALHTSTKSGAWKVSMTKLPPKAI